MPSLSPRHCCRLLRHSSPFSPATFPVQPGLASAQSATIREQFPPIAVQFVIIFAESRPTPASLTARRRRVAYISIPQRSRVSVDTDILIVGAGPTGLMLANQLARRGVRFRIIDRHAGPALQTRALGVQARTLEIYSHLGIANRALELGKRGVGANIWARGRRAARVPVGDIGQGLSPYPFLLILGQDDNERLLGDALRQHGVDVEWNTELVGLTQHPDRVIARLKNPDGTVRETTTRWVGGCDGARSAVRELNGIVFQGAPYEDVFFVADTVMTGPMVPDELNVYLWRKGFHLLFPMRGDNHWRIVGIVPEALRGRDNLTFDDVVPSIRQEAGSGLVFQKCSWFSTYRIHHRRAQRFRDRRCFLLGDAAHIHSPVGAQGMNTGLQDAYNLGWKLALVVSGQADARLLDSYEDERIPVAEALLGTTDRLFSLVISDNWTTGLLRTRLVPQLLGIAIRSPRVQKRAFLTISQTGITYRKSPISETLSGIPESAPRAGDRFPWIHLTFTDGGPREDLYQKLNDTRFALIVIGQPAPEGGIPALDGALQVLTIPVNAGNREELARVKVPETAFYLLRPDGYVGLAGVRVDAAEVNRYVSERLHLTAGVPTPRSAERVMPSGVSVQVEDLTTRAFTTKDTEGPRRL
jgi:2-polyprenyl-6-methoxyphenol hydroxylase-like FAD-dependent oxidoreductase